MSKDLYPGWEIQDTAAGLRLQRGRIILWCGDCDDVINQGQLVADAMATDPPFGIGRKPSVRRSTTGQRNRGEPARTWDMERISKDLLLKMIAMTNGNAAVWGGNYYADVLPASRGWLVWNKPDSPPSMADCELCWTSADKNIQQITQSIAATNKERCGHPTQKPLKVMRFTLSQFPCASVFFDPYMGSGTTGVACVEMERGFIGIEKDPRWFGVAVGRLTASLLAERSSLFPAVHRETQMEIFP